MKRRTFLKAAAGTASAAVLGAPSISRAEERVIKVVPISNLSGIDPIVTSGQPIRNHGYQIYDTLFGLDANLRAKPQMADGFEASADKKDWTIKLRDGLKFHDGQPVRATDCVASLRRWGQRDPLGQRMFTLADEVSVVDDRTMRFRFKSPFGLVPEALGKVGGPAPFIMPERIAKTDANTSITEAIGSGPFRFVADEWVPGNRAVYAKFDGYVPRNEEPSGTTGGKKVYVDRYEWHIIPDAATATAAAVRGEIDWYHNPDTNLLPLLQNESQIDLTPFDDFGYVTCIRFNHLHPPFDNVKMRQAIMMAVSQLDYLAAEAGDPTLYNECKSMFFCGTPSSIGAGGEVMTGNIEKAAQLIKEAGYKGEKIVLLAPTDLVWLYNANLVSEALLKSLGMNVELQTMDLGTFYTRRTKMDTVDKGGWSIFHAGWNVTDILDPSTHLGLQATGMTTWPGWPTDPDLEALRFDWIQAGTDDMRASIARKIEMRTFTTVPFVPLGQFKTPSARRKTITGMLKAPIPIAWNLQKA
ncbi:ABC transporter substrate-binding protein [Neorhizobium sp. T6_25]|uniref:ABC transporter substrate-binding protein n=1 Tax=Neorhizobium sp. T6_25 TaxID=2093833 RepID=UPI000CF85B78|nr:ABC transporter substrate-binding protein [Neorhizobium sp. T6_25]